MTNKYSELSYFQVNRKIDELFYDIFSIKYPFNNNWCNDHEVSFKLMISKKIELGFNQIMDKWVATFLFDDAVIMACNENPCRAIAECFLLMKDAENKDGQEA